MKKGTIILGKVLLFTFCGVLCLLLLLWGGLNVAKHFIYREYYESKTDICVNPGLGDGFICQGIAVSEERGLFFVSGYMTDKSASRVYVTDLENRSRFVTLTQGGESYTGHVGGVAATEDALYIASDAHIYTVPLQALLNTEAGGAVELGEGTEVNNAASYVSTDGEYLYVGEFHNGKKYVTEHPYETADGLYHAIVTRYRLDDLTTPDRVYAVRDKVQGVCFTPDGQILLSTSYGLASSVYYVYRESEASASGLMLDGAPVYYLDHSEREFTGPAMSEDLEWYDGRVITLTESASNKYIFGKFFFADKIVGIDLGR